jgi:hypothetical protein
MIYLQNIEGDKVNEDKPAVKLTQCSDTWLLAGLWMRKIHVSASPPSSLIMK